MCRHIIWIVTLPYRMIRWLLSDVKSALIGSGVATIITGLWIAVEEYSQSAFFQTGAGNGIGSPSQIIDVANSSYDGKKITLEPPELADTRVCEYYAGRGDDYFDIALDYILQYKTCFVVKDRVTNQDRWAITGALLVALEKITGLVSVAVEYKVGPNCWSGDLQYEQGLYWCKCNDFLAGVHARSLPRSERLPDGMSIPACPSRPKEAGD